MDYFLIILAIIWAFFVFKSIRVVKRPDGYYLSDHYQDGVSPDDRSWAYSFLTVSGVALILFLISVLP